jgi:hypothetical protein
MQRTQRLKMLYISLSSGIRVQRLPEVPTVLNLSPAPRDGISIPPITLRPIPAVWKIIGGDVHRALFNPLQELPKAQAEIGKYAVKDRKLSS